MSANEATLVSNMADLHHVDGLGKEAIHGKAGARAFGKWNKHTLAPAFANLHCTLLLTAGKGDCTNMLCSDNYTTTRRVSPQLCVYQLYVF